MNSLLYILTGAVYVLLIGFGLILCKSKKNKSQNRSNSNKQTSNTISSESNTTNKMTRKDQMLLAKKSKERMGKKGASCLKTQATQAPSAVKIVRTKKEQEEWDEQQATNRDAESLAMDSNLESTNNTLSNCPSISFRMGQKKK